MSEGGGGEGKRYWPPLRVGDRHIDLSHLEPRRTACEIEGRDEPLLIQARFSNHCFTVSFEDGVHDPSHLIMDHNQRRAFDEQRYELSGHLPGVIDNLPSCKVYQARDKNRGRQNFVYSHSIVSLADADYSVFFSIKKIGGNAHLDLFVESAYPLAKTQAGKRTGAIRFRVLVTKVFRGQRVDFAPR